MTGRIVCVIVAAAGLALADDDWGEPQRPPAAAAVKFVRHAVKDPMMNDVEAVSFLIPVGWKAEGAIQWYPDHQILANLLMRVSDTATGMAIEFLPMQYFTWVDNPVVPMQQGTNYMGSIVWRPIQDPREFVQTFYAPQTLRHLQGARAAATEDYPKVAAEMAKQYQGSPGPVTVRCWRVRYEFAGAGGAPWEEDVYVTLGYMPTDIGTFWSNSAAYSFRAPRGQLDRMTPVMNTTVQTVKLSAEWWSGYMYVQKLFMNRQRQGIEDARKISETITRNNEEIRRMFSDAYREQQASRDRVSESWSEAIRGVDTYKSPYEQVPVQLPAGYRDAWVNARGEYVLSNDAGYDPNVGSTTEWRRMDRRGEGGR